MPTGGRFVDRIRDLLLFYVATSSKNNLTRVLRTSLSGYVAVDNSWVYSISKLVGIVR